MNPVKQSDITLIETLIDESDSEAILETELNDPEVIYFVNEEGQYYYQQVGNQNDLPNSQGILADSENVLETGADKYQTVTLVPSDNNPEISYVLVVQEEPKPEQTLVNVDMKMDQNVEKIDGEIFSYKEEIVEIEELQQEGNTKSVPVKHRQLIFTCDFCNYTSNKRYLLHRHMKSHSDDKPHKCYICERGFKTIAALQNHLNMHNGVKPHDCKHCTSAFTTSGELIRHVRYKHTFEKPHKCSECDYATVEMSKLRRHSRCHTGERPYQCPHCTYASPDTFKLKRHLRTHTGEKPYKCDVCNMCFTQSNSLKAHKLKHNVEDRPTFQCELCPTKCTRKTDLRMHIQKLHTIGKAFKCKKCGKKLPDKYTSKVHNKSHAGEKSYKCELCPHAFTTQHQLMSHTLTHTNEKPFVCALCDQSFRRKQLLRRHERLYHNPDYVPTPPKEKIHTCNDCNRTFAHKGNLIRHLSVHDLDSGGQDTAVKGPQKNTKHIDGGLVEDLRVAHVENSELMKLGSEEDLKGGQSMAEVDGQQYVVLEVIRLGSCENQAVTSEFVDAGIETAKEQLEGEEHVIKKQISNLQQPMDHENYVDLCFGLDEGEQEHEIVDAYLKEAIDW